MAATDGMPKFFDALPPKYDEAALKKRFKQLSRVMHPDMNQGSEEANAEFKELTAEYARLLQQCRTKEEFKKLEESWMTAGGLAAAATLVFSAVPIVPAAAVAYSGINRASSYLASNNPARYAETARAEVEAHRPVEERALEAEQQAAAVAEARRLEFRASLRRQAAAAALEAEAAEEHTRAARIVEELTDEAREPLLARYRGRVSNAVDHLLLSRMDRLAIWWSRRRSGYRRKQRKSARVLAAERLAGAQKIARAAARAAEARAVAAAAAEAAAESAAQSSQEAERRFASISDEVARTLTAGDAKRHAAALAEGTHKDMQEIGSSVSGFMEALSGALAEGVAASVLATASSVEQAAQDVEKLRAQKAVEDAEVEWQLAKKAGDRHRVVKAKKELKQAKQDLRHLAARHSAKRSRTSRSRR